MKESLWLLTLLSVPMVMLYFLWSELNHLRSELVQLKLWLQTQAEMMKEIRSLQEKVMRARLEELTLRKAKRSAEGNQKDQRANHLADAVRYQVSPLSGKGF